MSVVDFSKERSAIRSFYAARDRDFKERQSMADYLRLERSRSRRRLLTLDPGANSQILDVGCGLGSWLVELKAEGFPECSLHGIDLDPVRQQKSRDLLPEADLRCGCATALPWPDAYFDGVMVSMLFSSLLSQAMREAVMAEIWRTLKPGAWLLIHDMRRVRKSEHLRSFCAQDLCALLPKDSEDFRFDRCILWPPLARLTTRLSSRLTRCLTKLPFMPSHWTAVVLRKVVS